MKKSINLLLLAAVSCTAFTSCLTGLTTTGTQSTATSQTTQTSDNQLGTLLSSLASSGTNGQSNLSSVLGNLLSSVTGSATTTQANLIGTWSYYEPAVQFESQNLLTQAGGAAAATQVESKLASIYQKVGITSGKMTFTFVKDGTVNYTIGSRSFSGTYVFDASAKTVTITTTTGLNLKAYVTISGQNMSLCFDSSKLLSLVSAYKGTQSTLSTLSTLASSFSGMKTGFKFKR